MLKTDMFINPTNVNLHQDDSGYYLDYTGITNTPYGTFEIHIPHLNLTIKSMLRTWDLVDALFERIVVEAELNNDGVSFYVRKIDNGGDCSE